MSTHGANIKDRKFLMPSTRDTDNKQCLICKKNIIRKSNQLVCSSCNNDCRNGMWSQIGKTIDKRIKKELNVILNKDVQK